MSRVGVVAIGRNEGDRLRLCLESLVGQGADAVAYVDSGSTDGSAALARSWGAEVVELDMTRPFSAARARNAGFEQLEQSLADLDAVFFLDGDCEAAPGWLGRGLAELRQQPRAAIVCGRRREKHPEASLYNRLADLEWDTPIGVSESCGGDSLVRAAAFREVGGFDPTAVAGEEPELCRRLREAGHLIVRIDAEMTRHDLAMFRFRQWWRRQIRNGYNGLDVTNRFASGRERLFAPKIRSARIWALGWPLTVAAAGLLGWSLSGGVAAAAAALLVGLALPAQVLRLAWKERRRVGDLGTALASGLLTMAAKFANLAGQILYYRDRWGGRQGRLIEYKRKEPQATPSRTRSPVNSGSKTG